MLQQPWVELGLAERLADLMNADVDVIDLAAVRAVRRQLDHLDAFFRTALEVAVAGVL